jgi:hypothetical protein
MAILSTDEIDWKLGADGDIPATGDLEFTTGIDAVMQGARIRLRQVRGEIFTNLDQGVRYFERDGVAARDAIMGQKFDRAKALREFRRALLGDKSLGVVGVPGIVELTRLECDFVTSTRTLTMTWQARTEFGDTPVDVIALGA